MSRRINKNRKKIHLNDLINEDIIKEIFDSKIKTEFKEINFGSYIAYRFKTSSDNEYDLEFHYAIELPNTKLSNGKTLGEVLNTNKSVNCFDIAFSLSNISDKSNPDEFELETNLNEINELFGRISYIISIIINKYKNCKLFIIGGDSRRNRLKIYEEIFKNHFNKIFDLYHGKSEAHHGESLFIIRK